jgi:hypothetical protein
MVVPKNGLNNLAKNGAQIRKYSQASERQAAPILWLELTTGCFARAAR